MKTYVATAATVELVDEDQPLVYQTTVVGENLDQAFIVFCDWLGKEFKRKWPHITDEDAMIPMDQYHPPAKFIVPDLIEPMEGAVWMVNNECIFNVVIFQVGGFDEKDDPWGRHHGRNE